MDTDYVCIFQTPQLSLVSEMSMERDRHKYISQGAELLFYHLGYSLPFSTSVTHCVSWSIGI